MSSADVLREAADRLLSGEIHLWAVVANADGAERGVNVAPEVATWLAAIEDRHRRYVDPDGDAICGHCYRLWPCAEASPAEHVARRVLAVKP